MVNNLEIMNQEATLKINMVEPAYGSINACGRVATSSKRSSIMSFDVSSFPFVISLLSY